MSREQDIMQEIRLDLGGRPDVRIFRNNVGSGWVGQTVQHTSDHIVLRNPRPLKSGLCVGSSDLIGWSIRHTARGPMAVFLAIEVKRPGERPTAQQQLFIDAVLRSGGIAGVARSVEDARDMVNP